MLLSEDLPLGSQAAARVRGLRCFAFGLRLLWNMAFAGAGKAETETRVLGFWGLGFRVLGV